MRQNELTVKVSVCKKDKQRIDPRGTAISKARGQISKDTREGQLARREENQVRERERERHAVLEAVGKTCFEEEGVFSLLIKCCGWVTVMGGKAERGRRTDPVVRVLVFWFLLSSE